MDIYSKEENPTGFVGSQTYCEFRCWYRELLDHIEYRFHLAQHAVLHRVRLGLQEVILHKAFDDINYSKGEREGPVAVLLGSSSYSDPWKELESVVVF